jgi:SAM-dependent methyltransferase
MTRGPDFYDEEQVFAAYMHRRQRPDSPNDTLEKPILMELISDVRGAAVLDLGCGDGAFGVELLAAGCQSYTGLEPSTRMFQLAQKRVSPVGGTVHQETIEMWQYPSSTFDLVVSRLALHYVAEIEQTFQQVYQTLKPGGSFVFSVEHR